MTKIRVTDGTDAKEAEEKAKKEVARATKKALAKAAKATENVRPAKSRKTSTTKKSTRKVAKKAVDARVAVPKKVQKIAVNKEEKKPARKKKKVTVEKTVTETKSVSVRSKKKATPKTEKVSEVKVEKAAEASSEKAEVKEGTAAKKEAPKRTAAHASAAASDLTHSNLQKSTTLSRRYVKRPGLEEKSKTEKIEEAPKTSHVEVEVPKAEVADTKLTEDSGAKEEVSAKTTPRLDKKAEKEAQKQAKLAEKAAREQARLDAKRAKAEEEERRKAEREATKLAKAQEEEQRRTAAKAAKLAKREARVAMPTLRQARPAKQPKMAKTTPDDKVLKSAMRNVATMSEPGETHGKFRKRRRGGRVVLALVCSAATVAALVAFVHFNMPDISVKVAAIQTGIDASYPDIVPRGYTLSSVSSDKDGEVSMTFKNSEDYSFTMTEEKSTWDSTALLTNYVRKVMTEDFVTQREQGITIYSQGDMAAWVNGGILYKVKSYGKNLTKEQIRNLATSV